MVSVRAARLDDAAGIAHVHVESWRTTYRGLLPDEYLNGLDKTARTASWHEWLAQETTVFVAELNGLIIGFAGGGPIRKLLPNYDAELYAIYLLESAQRRGTGTALLRVVGSTLVSQGFRSMAVWVLGDNPSTTFYERAGAVRVASADIEIAGVTLPLLAFGWPVLTAFA